MRILPVTKWCNHLVIDQQKACQCCHTANIDSLQGAKMNCRRILVLIEKVSTERTKAWTWIRQYKGGHGRFCRRFTSSCSQATYILIQRQPNHLVTHLCDDVWHVNAVAVGGKRIRFQQLQHSDAICPKVTREANPHFVLLAELLRWPEVIKGRYGEQDGVCMCMCECVCVCARTSPTQPHSIVWTRWIFNKKFQNNDVTYM